MSETTPGHKPPVKIYDRPATKGVSPIILVIAMIAVLLAGFFVYRFVSGAQRASKAQTSIVLPSRVLTLSVAVGTNL